MLLFCYYLHSNQFVIILLLSSLANKQTTAMKHSWIPGCFVPSLVEISSVVLKKIFKNCLKVFFSKSYFAIPSMDKAWSFGPSYRTCTVPFCQGYFVPSLSLVKIAQVGQNVKRLQNKRQMAHGRHVIYHILWTQVKRILDRSSET